MEKEKERIIEELAEEKLGGRSYSEIRSELKESGMSPDEISHIIRKVDERVLAEAKSGVQPDKAKQIYRMGLILAVIGLAISVAFNAGFLLRSIKPIIVYAPFLAGILLMFYARILQRRKPEAEPKGPGPIRKKRPYK